MKGHALRFIKESILDSIVTGGTVVFFIALSVMISEFQKQLDLEREV